MKLGRLLPPLRVLGWGLFLGLLASLGWVMWQLPPAPRCAIDTDPSKASMVLLSPDGNRLLVTSDQEAFARVWDTRSGALLTDLKIASAKTVINAGVSWQNVLPQFSSNGRFLALSVLWNRILLVDLDSARKYDLGAHGEFGVAHFSPDSRFFVVGQSESKVVHFYRCEDGKDFPYECETEFGFDTEARSFSPDGRYIALYSPPSIHVIEPGKPRPYFVITDVNYDPKAVFSSDGRRLMVWDDEGFGIWDIETRICERKIPERRKLWFLSPEDRWLVVPEKGVWEIESGHRVLSFDTRDVGHPFFSPDGQLLAMSNSKPWAHRAPCSCWDLRKGELLWNKDIAMALGDWELTPTFSHDSRAVWTVIGKSLTCRDARTGATVFETKDEAHTEPNAFFLAASARAPEQKGVDRILGWLGISRQWEIRVFPAGDPPNFRTLYTAFPQRRLLVSNCGNALLIDTLHGFEIWDLPLNSRWVESVGAPAALGLIGLLGYYWWRRRRAKRSVTSQAAL